MRQLMTRGFEVTRDQSSKLGLYGRQAILAAWFLINTFAADSRRCPPEGFPRPGLERHPLRATVKFLHALCLPADRSQFSDRPPTEPKSDFATMLSVE